MADLERELQRLVDPPLAEPAPVTDLEGRASRRRRYRWIRRAVAAGTAAALVAAFVVVATGGDATRVRPAAPSVTGGSADLFVQSTTVGDDGTRALLPPQLIEDDAFADPDVDVVDGQSRDFAVVVDEHDPTTIRLPTVALSWDESSDLALVDGARPEAPDEVALNRVAIDEYDLSVGDDVLLRFGGDVLAEVVEQLPTGTPTADPLREPTRDSNTYCSPGEACSAPEMRLEDLDNQASRTAADPSTSSGDQGTSLGTTSYGFEAVGRDPTGVETADSPREKNWFRIVGVLEPPGGDVPDVGLSAFEAAVAAERLHDEPGHDRIGVTAADDAEVDALARRIAAELPDGLEVVPASAPGSAAELRAELEIQQAYWLVADIDAEPEERAEAVDLPPDVIDELIDDYGDRADESAQNELRVQRVDFVGEDRARVAYDVRYAGALWPAGPYQLGDAVFVDGRWKLGSVTICQLAFLAGIPCPVERGDLPTEEPTTTAPPTTTTTVEPTTTTEPSTTTTPGEADEGAVCHCFALGSESADPASLPVWLSVLESLPGVIDVEEVDLGRATALFWVLKVYVDPEHVSVAVAERASELVGRAVGRVETTEDLATMHPRFWFEDPKSPGFWFDDRVVDED